MSHKISSANHTIIFPPYFRALKGYPGYFWHLEEQKLYSMKVQGILKPLARYDRWYNRHNRTYETWDYYQLSVRGRPVNIGVDKILKILEDPHMIPRV